MNLKVIVTDLDGTLLTKKKWISKTNLIYLTKFIKSGGIVCFITGRSLQSSIKIADKFKSKTGYSIKYIACFNGSIIYDNINKKIIESSLIDTSTVNLLLNHAKQFSLGYSHYYSYKDKILVHLCGYNIIINIINFFNKKSSIRKLDSNKKIIEDVYKINIFKKNSKKKFLKFKNKLNSIENKNFNYSLTAKSLIEFMPKNINKGYAAKKISSILNVPLEQFIAFGDSPNDLPMLELIPNSYITRDKYLNKYGYKFNKEFKQKNAIGKWLQTEFYLKNK